MTDDPTGADGGDADDPDRPVRPDGERAAGDATRGEAGANGERTDPDGRVPFADLAAGVAERERRRAAADDPFEAVDVPEFDGDVWAALEDEADSAGRSPATSDTDADANAVDGEQTAGGAADVDAGGESTLDRAERVVDKREYCQQCPHLAPPPTLACTHAGTEIVEVLDGDDLRVRGCPVVDDAAGPE